MTTSATPITPPMRVPLSRTSGLALLALLVLVLSASLPGRLLAQAAPPPSAESRLEALRNALLERALKAPARLRSAAWIDESGTLRENLQIQSDVKLRGIRVLSYLEEGGALKADVLADTASAPDNCQGSGHLKRQALLSMSHEPQDGRLAYHQLPELTAHAQQTLLAGFALDEAWVLTPATTATSTYEQALAAPGPQATPYLLQLKLEASDGDHRFVQGSLIQTVHKGRPTAPRNEILESLGLYGGPPEKSIRLSLRLLERSSNRVLWSETRGLVYPDPGRNLQRQPLPASLTEPIEALLGDWRLKMGKALACEPLQLSVAAIETVPGDQNERLALNAGNRIGLRVGDKLLLVDRTRFPRKSLETGTLDRAALIEVLSVSADGAYAKRVAGPAPTAPLTNLVAMPL